MPRKDYEEIRRTFTAVAESLAGLAASFPDDVFLPDAACAPDIRASLTIEREPVQDARVVHVCNFVCRLAGDVASQSAMAVFRERAGEEKNRAGECTALFAAQWRRQEKEWLIAELRMDIMDISCDAASFMPGAPLHPLLAAAGSELPHINGELDSPWIRVADAEDVLTEEEKIQETFARYAFGIDTLAFAELPSVFLPDLSVNMPPWGLMDLRTFLTTLKAQRQTVKHWAHPAITDTVTVSGNQAVLRLLRLSGHRDSTRGDMFTGDGKELACARYDWKARKENGRWRFTECVYAREKVSLKRHCHT